MPWLAGDEVWAVYCHNVDGEGLRYVADLAGTVARVEGDTLVVRRARPGPKGELLLRLYARGRAWSSREPAEAWCAEKVGPYGPSMGKGAMGVAGNGSASAQSSVRRQD
jgi:hypothetical protein